MARKTKFPKITRKQAHAVKAAADALTKADRLYQQGQQIIKRAPDKAKIKVPGFEEQAMRHWAVYDGIINGSIPARQGFELLEHGPLGYLRLVEAKERDNGKRRKTRPRIR